MAHTILFEHANFHGAHRHVVSAEPSLAAADDNFFNDRVSSVAVLSGRWAFYRHAGFEGRYGRTLGPGLYPSVRGMDIQNDDMSSLAPLGESQQATVAHVILFEHANFHGAHKHVLMAEPSLAAADDSFFNDRVSSIVVVSGNWRLYRHAGFRGRYPITLGPGAYPWVGSLDIENDDMSSLQPSTIAGRADLPHAILFEHANFRGAHKHVVGPEPSLNATDDRFFNDRVSSIVILSGVWAFYRHADFEGRYPYLLGPGMYSWVGALDLQNDDMSSLRPVSEV